MTVLFVTLGFDEKFQVRAVMRWYSELERVIIVGSFNGEKAKKALDSLVEVLNKGEVQYEVIDVNPRDPIDVVVKVGYKIEENKGKKLVFNLSGGMRVLGILTLLTALMNGVDAEVELETEDFSGIVKFNVNDFTPVRKKLDEVDLKVLDAAEKGYNTVTSISKYVGIPVSTTWRRVKELKEEGLLNEELKITFKGRLIIASHGFSHV